MTQQELIADNLARNLEMLNWTLGDFTDQEMLTRPVPAANHAAWQLGHLIAAETSLINSVTPGALPELPAGFAEKFSKDKSKSDDPKAFPPKKELIELLTKTRQKTVAWAKGLSDADLAKPVIGNMQQMCPTVAHMALLQIGHIAMHVGQFQVIRRKLGKPVLF